MTMLRLHAGLFEQDIANQFQVNGIQDSLPLDKFFVPAAQRYSIVVTLRLNTPTQFWQKYPNYATKIFVEQPQ